MKLSEFLGTSFAFGHLAANVRVRCSDCSKLLVYAVYSNRRLPSLFGEHCKILRWRTLRKTLKRWWGRLEKRRVATESGGDETGDDNGGPGDETGDKTSPKRPNGQKNVSKEIINQLCIFGFVFCVLCITVLCCANNQMQIFSTKLLFFHKNVRIYFV